LLAPCFFRDGDGGLEAQSPAQWEPRAKAQLQAVLGGAGAHVVCLQEVWLDSRMLALVHAAAEEHGFRVVVCQPRGGGGERPDGVAILLREGRLEVQETAQETLCQETGRMLLLAHVRLLGVGKDALELAVGCTHLTHPHGDHTNRLRMVQAWKAGLAVKAFLKARCGEDGAAAVLAGDLNAVVPKDDAALEALTSLGWASAFAEVHDQDAFVTHRAHTGRAMHADFVLLWGPVRAVAAAALPWSAPADAAIPAARAGAAARGGLDVSPQGLLQDWAQLSDHRPVVADLELGPRGRGATPRVGMVDALQGG